MFLKFVEIDILQYFILPVGKDEVCLRIAWAFLSCIKGFVRTSTAAGIAHAFLSAKMNGHSVAI